MRRLSDWIRFKVSLSARLGIYLLNVLFITAGTPISPTSWTGSLIIYEPAQVFGAVRQDTQQVYLDFCDGQPDTRHTLLFVWALLNLARREHKQVVVIIWDN